jgi:hypothetical protein
MERSLTMRIIRDLDQTAKDVNSAVQEFLEKENKEVTTPGEVVDFLVEKGVVENEKKRKLKTVQLEIILSEVTRLGRTNLIPGLRSEKTKKKTLWYFDRA